MITDVKTDVTKRNASDDSNIRLRNRFNTIEMSAWLFEVWTSGRKTCFRCEGTLKNLLFRKEGKSTEDIIRVKMQVQRQDTKG